MRSYLLLCLFLISGSHALHAQESGNYSARIDSLIQTKNPRAFNGVILITQKGVVKYSKAYGFADFAKKIPLKVGDNFRIQSNSKQITAVLILKEVEKGTVDLNAAVKKYLPAIKQPWVDTVTVHQLLNFSAGVVDIDKPLLFKPGTDFLYSVVAYTMLGDIIEKVTGKSFSENAQALFRQLGMRNSFCYEREDDKSRMVNGYTGSKEGYKSAGLVMTARERKDFIPAGGVVSTAADLNRWDSLLHHGHLLRPDTYKLMTSYSITAQHEAFGPGKIGYGYGIRIGDQAPVRFIGHSGKGLGFVSIKVYFPESDTDLIVLENVYDDDASLHYYFEIKIREIVMNSELVSGN